MEGKMKKLFLIISTFLFTSILTTFGFSAGDEATIKKLSSMYKSGDTTKAIVVPQDTKFAANIKKIYCQILRCLLDFQLNYLL